MHTVSRWAFAMVCALAGPLVGCGGSAAIRAAEAGNWSELRRAILEEQKNGSLDDADARAIARAAASYEIQTAAGAAGAEKIQGYATCARHVDAALDDRADRSDAPGAAAEMLRLEQGLDDPDDAEDRAREAGAAVTSGNVVEWKAVLALGEEERCGERTRLQA